MNEIKPIHPFPARMAPEIAFEETASLPHGSLVMDQMTGSGTSIRIASEQGHRAIGFDLDPLAVLMSKVWTRPINVSKLRERAAAIAAEAEQLNTAEVELPWIDHDRETTDFIEYWFANSQRDDLRKISSLLAGKRGPIADALRIALSRIVITKQRGASLAWDVSHSRPHKKRDENDFQVITEFLKSVEFIAKRLREQPPPGNVHVAIADARQLSDVEAGSVDAIITSPPYLNALDYMRGHRLALVWLGYSISPLRVTRAESIGNERNPAEDANIELADELCAVLDTFENLPERQSNLVRRYALDIYAMVAEMYRVLRTRGTAVLVVGNSCLRGIFIQNSLIVTTAAEHVGFELIRERERNLPTSKRYLPPPTANEQSTLNKRMKTESILTFIKA